MTDVSEFPYGDRKGVSTIETNLLREIRELKNQKAKLETDLRIANQIIDRLRDVTKNV